VLGSVYTRNCNSAGEIITELPLPNLAVVWTLM
jgi:hypothetical protein